MVRPPEPLGAPTHPRAQAHHPTRQPSPAPTGPEGHFSLLPVLQSQVRRRPERRRFTLRGPMVLLPRTLPPLGRRVASHHRFSPHIHRDQRPLRVPHRRHPPRRTHRRPGRPLHRSAPSGERVAVRDGEGGERDHEGAGQVAGGSSGAGGGRWGWECGGEDRRTDECVGEGG